VLGPDVLRPEKTPSELFDGLDRSRFVEQEYGWRVEPEAKIGYRIKTASYHLSIAIRCERLIATDHDRALECCAPTAEGVTSRLAHKIDHHWREAVSSYSRILRDRPTFSRRDEVALWLGWVLEERALFDARKNEVITGTLRRDAALEVARKSLDEQPSSAFAPRTQLLVAELLFSGYDEIGALPLYVEALRSQDLSPPLAAFTHYRIAWCHLKMGGTPRAEASFDEAVKLAREHPSARWSAPLEEAIAAERGTKLEFQSNSGSPATP